MDNLEKEIPKELLREWMKIERQLSSSSLYEVQEDKLGLVNDLIAICKQFAETHNGLCRFRNFNISPKYGFSGSVSLAFSSDLNIGELPDDMKNFKKMLDLSDGFNVEPFGEEEVFLNFFVCGLWKPKKK